MYDVLLRIIYWTTAGVGVTMLVWLYISRFVRDSNLDKRMARDVAKTMVHKHGTHAEDEIKKMIMKDALKRIEECATDQWITVETLREAERLCVKYREKQRRGL